MPAIRVYVRRRQRRRRARAEAQGATATLKVRLPSTLGSPTVAEVNWRRVHQRGRLIGWQSDVLGQQWVMPDDAWLD